MTMALVVSCSKRCMDASEVILFHEGKRSMTCARLNIWLIVRTSEQAFSLSVYINTQRERDCISVDEILHISTWQDVDVSAIAIAFALLHLTRR